jgi:hypothetical protein
MIISMTSAFVTGAPSSRVHLSSGAPRQTRDGLLTRASVEHAAIQGISAFIEAGLAGTGREST